MRIEQVFEKGILKQEDVSKEAINQALCVMPDEAHRSKGDCHVEGYGRIEGGSLISVVGGFSCWAAPNLYQQGLLVPESGSQGLPGFRGLFHDHHRFS